MNYKKVLAKFFGFAESTIFKWEKEERPIIEFLNKYFTKEDLVEFIETNKVSKLEILNSISLSDFEDFKDFKDKILLEEIEKKKQEIDELTKKLTNKKENQNPLDNLMEKYDSVHHQNNNKEKELDAFSLNKINKNR